MRHCFSVLAGSCFPQEAVGVVCCACAVNGHAAAALPRIPRKFSPFHARSKPASLMQHNPPESGHDSRLQSRQLWADTVEKVVAITGES
jgi:hypothetical protein